MAWSTSAERVSRSAEENQKSSGTLGRKTLAMQAADRLREAILSGDLNPGERLREESLAQRLDVSRQVVREVLYHLEAMGLVGNDPFRGRFVIDVNRRTLSELAPIRAMLECYAANLAARNATPESAQELAHRASEIARPDLTFAQFKELDRRFHEAVWRIAGSASLIRVLRQVSAPFFMRTAYMAADITTEPAELVEQERQHEIRDDALGHVALAEALSNGDADKSIELMRRHIMDTWGEKFASTAPRSQVPPDALT